LGHHRDDAALIAWAANVDALAEEWRGPLVR